MPVPVRSFGATTAGLQSRLPRPLRFDKMMPHLPLIPSLVAPAFQTIHRFHFMFLLLVQLLLCLSSFNFEDEAKKGLSRSAWRKNLTLCWHWCIFVRGSPRFVRIQSQWLARSGFWNFWIDSKRSWNKHEIGMINEVTRCVFDSTTICDEYSFGGRSRPKKEKLVSSKNM